MKFFREVTLCEVSLRDGLQTLPVVPVGKKLELLDLIVDTGITEVEVGSLISERKEIHSMHNTPEVFQKMKRKEGVVYRALIQSPHGAQEAVDCGCKKVKLNISGSIKHYEKMTRKTIQQGLYDFGKIGKICSQNNIDMLGSISLAFVSPYDGTIPLDDIRTITAALLDAGATEISLNDTAGMATPKMVYERFSELRSYFPQVKAWAFHAHNTRGMALANILAACEAGVSKLDSSLAGIGGCTVFQNASGNIATEDLLYMLHGMGVNTGVSFEKALVAGAYVEDLVHQRGIDSYIQRLEKIKRLEKHD